MFTAVLFTIDKVWKQTKHRSIDKWTEKMWYTYTNTHTHTHRYYSSIKKNEILPFLTTWKT